LWTEIKYQYYYKIIIGEDNAFNLAKDSYSVQKVYKGKGDNEGLYILTIPYEEIGETFYIISDKIGSDIEFTSNIPQCLDLQGTYVLDTEKAPFSGQSWAARRTLYKSENNYIALEDDHFRMFGDKIMPNDDHHNQPRFNRDGVMMDWYNNFIKTSGVFDDEVSATSFNYGYGIDTTFMVTQAEYDADNDAPTKIPADARTAHEELNYVYKYESLDNWSGWFSSSLTGIYEAFGESEGTKKLVTISTWTITRISMF